MTTQYQTANQWEPIRAELWTYSGQRLGVLTEYESLAFVFADRSADTAELHVPLTRLTRSLVPCDGRVLIAMRYGGRTHLTTPVTAEVTAGPDPAHAWTKVTCAGGWALLDGQRIPPSLEIPITEQTLAEYTLKGPLETVVKRLVQLGSVRNGHPVIVLPDQGRGPEVTVSGGWESVGETVKTLLARTGYRLDLAGWVPGDVQPDGYSLRTPAVIADVVPYQTRPGLVWSVTGGDITDWSVTHHRAKATKGTVGYATDKMETRRYLKVDGAPQTSPWAVRELYTTYSSHKEIDDREPDPRRVAEGMERTGADMLTESAASMELSAKVDTSHLWTMAVDPAVPRSFDVGTVAEVDLPVLGRFKQVITQVEVVLTPEDFTVSPTVGTPDTLDADLYSVVARMSNRVDTLER